MNRFPCLNLQGGLIATDLLDQIADGLAPGQKPADFGLDARRHLTDEVAAAWTDARAYWQAFQRRLERIPPDDAATGVTRDQWIIPLLSLLGYELAYTARAAEVDGLTFAISHRAGSTEEAPPVHVVGCRQSLDRRPESGRPRLGPHSLLQEYLNRTENLWGIATNGETLRILRNSQLLRRQAYLEFDLKQMMEGEKFADFGILYRIIHRTRLPATSADAAECLLEKYHRITLEQGGRVRDHLRDGVEEAMKILANAFLQHPRNASLREVITGNRLNALAFYQEILRLIYRLLFLMVAEERNLISDHPVYREHYSISRLRLLARDRKAYSEQTDLWLSLQTTFRLFQSEELGAMLGTPPLNGDLFEFERTGDLNSLNLSNRDLLSALWNLSMYREDPRTPWRPINYSALDVEELGSVYESLLDFTPRFIPQNGGVVFDLAYGTERKSTGSYYTPPELVNELIKSALVPVLEERIKSAKTTEEKEKAILGIKVCDPAAGSGHFLLAAARTLGRELAKIRTGDDEPAPEPLRLAVRESITHCIYGVDKNPLAVDLCKVALWMEGHAKGKPLTFLDHRIRCGDSLIGATPELLKKGIPTDAFKSLEGDEPAVATAIRKRNKEELKGQRGLFTIAEASPAWQTTVSGFHTLETLPENKPQEINEKARRYELLRSDPSYLHKKRVADLWTAAFFWPLTKESSESVPTQAVFQQFEEGDYALRKEMENRLHDLSTQYQFFHWHLEFPDVFMKRQGFDCILSNPPWEKITTLEREFFSSIPEIVEEKRSDRRKALILVLKSSDPVLYAHWSEQLRNDSACMHFLRISSRFPLSAVGELNLYPLFVELSEHLIGDSGTVGMIIKTGMMLSPTWADFSSYLLDNDRIESAFDFRNWKGWFPDIGYHERFTLLTMRKGRQKQDIVLGYYLDDTTEMRDTAKTFTITRDEAIRLNPITKTVPAFESSLHKTCVMAVYDRFPVLGDKASEWGVHYTSGLHMAAEADKLRDFEELAAERFEPDEFLRMNKGENAFVPLYEGKFIHQFDHRFASFEGIPRKNRFGIKAGTHNPTEDQRKNPAYHITPRYWISEEDTASDREARHLKGDWAIAFRDTTNVISNFRTSVACICSGVAYNYKAPNIMLEGRSEQERAKASLLFVTMMNSFPFDYVVRQKFFGANFIKSILLQLAAPSMTVIQRHQSFILPRALELSYTSWQLEGFAAECGFKGQPFIWDEIRRQQIRAELDALFFHIYGFSVDNAAFILDSYRILREKDAERFGEYRTKRLILEIYDAMQRAKETGQPYQTILDPPPADHHLAVKRQDLGNDGHD